MYGTTKSQVAYAVKIYISAMLAYFFAVEIGLSNPYWSIVTCVVLANPLSGLLYARAIYRLIGTLIAGALSLLLSALFINEPILLISLTGLISALILTMSFADRTPKAYSFQLAGVTMMLVLIAYMGQPSTMFPMVTSRVLEICIGILAIMFVDSFWQPGSSLATLRARKDNWINDLTKWREDSFLALSDHSVDQDRIKLLNDVSSLSQSVSTMKYDFSIDKQTRQALIALQKSIIRLIPRIAAIAHAMTGLSKETHAKILKPQNRLLLNSTEQSLNFSKIPTSVYIQASPWEKMILKQLEQLLLQHKDDWLELMKLNQLVDGHSVNKETINSAMKAKALPLIRDTGLMVRMFAGISLTYSILCSIWYFTGWMQGPNLVLLGVVAIGFFGAADEPGTTIKQFGRFTFISVLMAFFLSYVLLPLANNYAGFLIVMAMYMLPIGLWASKNPLALLALALSLSTINLQSHYTPFNIDYFLENAIASLVGVHVAFVAASAFRRWGAQNAIEQLIKREKKDALSLHYRFNEPAVQKYATRALDRMALQATRLEVSIEKTNFIVLAGICANVYAARLRQATSESSELQFIKPLLLLLTKYDRQDDTTTSALIKQIDLSLQISHEQGLSDVQRLLTGLRLAMFPHSPNWKLTHA
ncbi:FUSC family protein [Pseudoalteromonas sp. N1230-9]|uniref:FUSC family protein n=1 Tax=Pseudoalteromonas sp. N1230-9 TaxID=2907156 RepID=UPI002B2C75B8|nr:FUSC family protein [Pseudoalteromonas sp. N1230-9]